MGSIWFVVGMVLLAVAGVALGWWAHKARIAELERWAAANGWTHHGPDPALARRWRGEPFDEGRSRRATEVLTGPHGDRSALSFTYSWTTGSGKESTTHTAHVVALLLDASFPTLQLTPEGLGAKLAKAFGGQDIQLESEDFNRAWRVESSDLRFAHDVLHPRTMHRLLEADFSRRSLRIEGDAILAWTGGRTVPDNVPPMLSRLAAVVDAVPDFVWLDRGALPPRRPGTPTAGPGPAAGPGAAPPWGTPPS
ncbi:hypothetical protein H9623_15305 [Oerskovia sp. Sa1BUA8]|uniref:DUF3137 domain-containing protein n=1 Tax=Oerskovia douganii TaxID=2762210 RepID=A0A9D5UAT1_9CELL|nr:DUF3137 domain-containing protein [Oerskovia douganii]MBE7701659.1 hypothetical protein [Oerskovia douganii]